MASVFPIAAGTQSYDWGKVRRASKAAQYAASGVPGFTLDEAKPYAELWMGTHPTLPSRLLSTQETLSEHLAAHAELVGSAIAGRFPEAGTGNLPFLFKILAIQKALSIQAHPDKQLAERLHAARPDLYKDANHKPEMAIALTPFTALCGFRPLCEIGAYLTHVSELAALVPPAILASFLCVCTTSVADVPTKVPLRDFFTAVVSAPLDLVAAQLRALVARYKARRHAPAEADFPGDIGVFCVYLLNVVKLQPGEAIFLGAGEPHAYVAGDIVETMATSDNVLRAGLTPKTRDVPNLVSSLTYHASPPSAHIVTPAPFPRASESTKLYNPPVPEFAVLLTHISQGNTETHDTLQGPSLLIVTQGKGRAVWPGGDPLPLNEGSVVFVGADTKVTFEASEEMTLFRAFVEV
ncbi:mannose-6-phosphate isomerase [Gautieria morchelliformis]|nr:mannose-6-phosphate isomerase [Gautieria morchelliformis]